MIKKCPVPPPEEPRRYLAMVLAALMHVLLFLFLWIGIRWQNKEAVGVDAEIWDVTTREAAPKVLSTPDISPVSSPVAQTPEQQDPVPELPPPVQEKGPTPQQIRQKLAEQKQAEEAEIAIERARKQKLLDQQHALEQKQRQDQLEKQKEDELKLAKLKKEELRKDDLRKEEAREKQRKADDAAKEKLRKEQQDKVAAEQKKIDLKKADEQKQKADKARDLKEQQRQNEQADTLRLANLQRMTGGVSPGKFSGSGGAGDAAKSTGGRGGADAGYGDRIGAKIRSNSSYSASESQSGNPTVEYRVQLFPDGSLKGTPKMTKSSGVPAFDQAIARAIEKSAPFPPDKTGNVPPVFEFVNSMKKEN